MPEIDHADQWVRRCAQRLQVRHTMTSDEAADLAHALLASGSDACPERVADDFLRTPMEV